MARDLGTGSDNTGGNCLPGLICPERHSLGANAGLPLRATALSLDVAIPLLLAWTIDAFLDWLDVPASFSFEAMAIMLLGASVLLNLVSKGHTPGKCLLGLALRRQNGRSLSWPRFLVREIVGKCACIFFLGLGFLWMAFSKQKRGWHDYIAGSVVISRPDCLRQRAVTLVLSLTLCASVLATLLLNLWLTHARNVTSSEALNVANASRADMAVCKEYLREHAQSPQDYVISKFTEHDVVIIGEGHQVRENCEFISSLMNGLYHQAGVCCFAMEMIKYKNTDLANELVTAKEYDEEKAKQIFRDYIWPSWGYKEYMDQLKAIWKVNRALPPGAEKLKVVGLDKDIPGWDLYLESPRSILAWLMCIGRDDYMARVLRREVFNKRSKALVQVGAHHDFTRYRQPLALNNRLVLLRPARLGALLYGRYKLKLTDFTPPGVFRGGGGRVSHGCA
jgi:uncharacterized RDD family membrane protein YckC